MKKTILTIATLFLINSLSAVVTIHKERGGAFGYRYVTTTQGSNGNTHVDCTDPGITRCKAAVMDISVTPGGPTLTEEAFDAIDTAVNTAITPTNLNGQLIYNDLFYVTYAYNVETDQLVISIYSIAEAQSLGLLP